MIILRGWQSDFHGGLWRDRWQKQKARNEDWRGRIQYAWGGQGRAEGLHGNQQVSLRRWDKLASLITPRGVYYSFFIFMHGGKSDGESLIGQGVRIVPLSLMIPHSCKRVPFRMYGRPSFVLIQHSEGSIADGPWQSASFIAVPSLFKAFLMWKCVHVKYWLNQGSPGFASFFGLLSVRDSFVLSINEGELKQVYPDPSPANSQRRCMIHAQHWRPEAIAATRMNTLSSVLSPLATKRASPMSYPDPLKKDGHAWRCDFRIRQ